jgi:hypothetical protein
MTLEAIKVAAIFATAFGIGHFLFNDLPYIVRQIRNAR